VVRPQTKIALLMDGKKEYYKPMESQKTGKPRIRWFDYE
jgi:hypothetical protein